MHHITSYHPVFIYMLCNSCCHLPLIPSLTKEEFESIKAAPIKKKLKEIVKTLARQVDADWHDGYEEQAETKAEWFEAIEEPLQVCIFDDSVILPNTY